MVIPTYITLPYRIYITTIIPVLACHSLVDLSFPWTGAVHNHRHSGESRNPEGKGNGEAHVI